MLTREENELMCRVGPETPMGQMLRRYWIPACLIEEVAEPGGTPVRLRLLGEDLVAFRNTEGVLGIIDEKCPHRGASMALGRNEDCGLTCIYHGWRVAPDGRLLETPSEPENSTFKDRLRHRAYPVKEAGGFVWVYMGPQDKMPEFPNYEWLSMPDDHVAIAKAQEAANWVQSLEGAIDSAHSSTLHSDAFKASDNVERSTAGPEQDQFINIRPSNDRRPKLEAEDTAYGFRYAAIRKTIKNPDTTKYVRITAHAMPFIVFIPPNSVERLAQIFVPMDDYTTMFYWVKWSQDRKMSSEAWRKALHLVPGVDVDPSHYWRKSRSIDNWFLQDREAMKSGAIYSGIAGIPNQDMAVQETMGPIVDRSIEHLGTSDVAIIRMRKILLNSVKGFMQGEEPVGLREPYPADKIRGVEQVVPIDMDWRELAAEASGETADKLRIAQAEARAQAAGTSS